METGPNTTIRKRGISPLFMVMVALAIFSIFTVAVGKLAVQRLRGSSRALQQMRASYACEAGFVLATEWLEKQIVYNNTTNTLSFNPINPATFNASHTNITLAQDKETKLTVRVTSNLLPPASGAPTAIIGPDGVNVQPGQLYVMTVATTGSDLTPASSRHLGGFASLGTQDYAYAIHCEGPINLTNSIVMTYTSYDVGNPNNALTAFWEYHDIDIDWFPPPPDVDLVHKSNCVHNNGGMPGGGSLFPGRARVLSNARVNAIRLNNSRVDGQLFCGPGATPSVAVTATPAQSWVPPPTASDFPLFITKYKPPVEPNTLTATHNGGSLGVSSGTFYKSCRVNSGTLTLNCNQAGANEFYFDTLEMRPGTRIVLNNAGLNTRAKVYVGKQLTLNGCRVNALNNPEGPGAGPGAWKPDLQGKAEDWDFNLLFLGVGGGGPLSSPTGSTAVNITGNSVVCGLFAGRAMNFNMTGGQLLGAVKCNTVNMTNVQMFYDVGVNAPSIASTLWGRVSWTMTGVTDYGPALYQLAQSGLGPAGAIAPQGPGAMGVGQVGAGVVSNLGANGGASIAMPGPAQVGTGGAAAAASYNAASASPSFWAALFLGQ